jgi:hypothetical protein
MSANYLIESFHVISPIILDFIVDIQTLCSLSDLDDSISDEIQSFFSSESRRSTLSLSHGSKMDIRHSSKAQSLILKTKRMILDSPDNQLVCIETASSCYSRT